MSEGEIKAKEFAESLPQTYRERYQGDALLAHARIAAERGDAAANVGPFPCKQPTLCGICVIAPDRPGLLSTISSALLVVGLDVEEAEVYTRLIDDAPAEAVDLFWVRRTNGTPVESDEIETLRTTLLGVISGSISVPSTPPPPPAEESLPEPAADTKVRFLEGPTGVLDTLEVETDDRSGLLMALTRALFNEGVQIVHSEVRTRNRRVFDRFSIVELDGAPISPARRLTIQVAILTAVERKHQGQREDSVTA